MEFFGMGAGEVFLILVLVLILFGPKRIPEIARTMGKVMHDLRKASAELTATVTREIEDEKKHQSAQKTPENTQKTAPVKQESNQPTPTEKDRIEE